MQARGGTSLRGKAVLDEAVPNLFQGCVPRVRDRGPAVTIKRLQINVSLAISRRQFLSFSSPCSARKS